MMDFFYVLFVLLPLTSLLYFFNSRFQNNSIIYENFDYIIQDPTKKVTIHKTCWAEIYAFVEISTHDSKKSSTDFSAKR
eukprot:UN00021